MEWNPESFTKPTKPTAPQSHASKGFHHVPFTPIFG